MTVSTVTKFKTSDGTLHDTRADAEQHENRTTAVAKLSQLLQSTLTTMRPDAVLRHIIEESTAVRDILNSYNRRKPRQKA